MENLEGLHRWCRGWAHVLHFLKTPLYVLTWAWYRGYPCAKECGRLGLGGWLALTWEEERAVVLAEAVGYHGPRLGQSLVDYAYGVRRSSFYPHAGPVGSNHE